MRKRKEQEIAAVNHTIHIQYIIYIYIHNIYDISCILFLSNIKLCCRLELQQDASDAFISI